MLKFFDDYEKLHPQKQEDVKEVVNEVPNMTTDDMKKYFDAMKENLMSEIREQIKQINNNPQVKAPIEVDNNVASQNNNNEGGNDNASNTDL